MRCYPIVIQDNSAIERDLKTLKYVLICFVVVLLPSGLIIAILISGKYELRDGSKVCLNLYPSIWNCWYSLFYLTYFYGGFVVFRIQYKMKQCDIQVQQLKRQLDFHVFVIPCIIATTFLFFAANIVNLWVFPQIGRQFLCVSETIDGTLNHCFMFYSLNKQEMWTLLKDDEDSSDELSLYEIVGAHAVEKKHKPPPVTVYVELPGFHIIKITEELAISEGLEEYIIRKRGTLHAIEKYMRRGMTCIDSLHWPTCRSKEDLYDRGVALQQQQIRRMSFYE